MSDYLGRPCPAWCSGWHGTEPPWGGVLYHESEPVVLDVFTDLVEVQCISYLIQFPDAANPRHRNVTARSTVVTAVGMQRPSDVFAYANMLTGYADRLRRLTADLAAAQVEDHAARSWRT